MPTSPVRRSRVQLTVSSPTEAPEVEGRIPSVPWLVAAMSWSAGAAVLGLAAVAVPVLAAWLTALRTPGSDVLETVVQLWVAAQGADAVVDGVLVGVTPLGLTLVLAAACAMAAHHAGVQARVAGEPTGSSPWKTWVAVSAVCGATYTGVCVLLALILAHPDQAIGVAVGAGLLSVAGAMPGAGQGLGLNPLQGRPAWVRRLPRAVGLGFAVLVVGSLAALVISLVAHRQQVALMHDALAPDVVGTVLLILLQLAYLPNLIAWAGSWALGGGISLGVDTVVSPGVTSVGILPALPVFGALPANGEGWSWVWMLLGTTAGIVATVYLVRGLPRERQEDLEGWPWQGGVAGVLVGLVWAVFALVSRGDLGVDRLVGLGPRFPDIVWLAAMGIGLAGAAAGIGSYIWAQRHLPPEAGNEAHAEGEDASLATVGAGTDEGTRPIS